MAAPINIQGLQADGAQGSDFGARITVVVGITTRVAIPRGLWWVENDSHVLVQKQTDAAGTYVTMIPASTNGMVWSDGYSVNFLGDGTGGNGIRTLLRAVSPTQTAS